jgi:hypothetical protein
VRNVAVQLDSIHVGLNDIVVVRVCGDGGDRTDIGAKVTAKLRQRGLDNLVLVEAEGASVESLSPEAMATHGWFRKAKSRTGGA